MSRMSMNMNGKRHNVLNKIPNKNAVESWANRNSDGYLIDKIGKTTFDPVRPAYIVGDGNTYFKVASGIVYDGLSFTYNRRFIYNGAPAKTFLTVGETTNAGLIVDLYNGAVRVFGYFNGDDLKIIIGTHGFVTGKEYLLSVVIINLSVTISIDGSELQTGSLVSQRTPSTELTFMARITTGVSTDKIISEEITDSNNNTYLLNPQCLINTDGTYNDFVPLSHADGLPDVIAQQMLQPAIPAVYDDSLAVGSLLNEDGYLLAETLGKNLFPKGSVAVGYYVEITSGTLSGGGTNDADCSYFIPIKSGVQYIKSGGASANEGYALYDSDKVYITGQFNNTFTPTEDGYVRVTCKHVDLDVFQLEEGTTATTYEPWKGYFVDEALTTPYPTGYRIPPLTGTINSVAWMDDGTGTAVRAPRSVGPVKINPRIVDGVVDLELLDYTAEHYGSLESSDVTEVIVSSLGNSIYARAISNVIDSNNALYTVKCKAEKIIGTNTPRLSVFDGTNLVELLSIDFTIDDQEYVGTFTPTTSDYVLRFYPNRSGGGVAEVSEARFYDFKIFEGTEEPTSQTFTEGNSFVLDTAYNQAVKADTADYLFDDTDPTEVTSKLLPCSDVNYGDYLFTSDTKDIVALYDSVQTGDNLNKTLLKLGLYEYATDSTGAKAIDSEGNLAIAPTEELEEY